MKKALVVLLALAVVGGAFAADVGGTVIGTVIPVQGDSGGGDVKAGGTWGRSEFSASGQNEEGTFGGWVRLRAGNYNYPNSWSSGASVNGFGYVWWKPIQQFQIQFGSNPDGHFGVNDIVGWGFSTSGGDVSVAIENWKYGSIFGGFGGGLEQGAILTITPMEALAINVAIPFIGYAVGSTGVDEDPIPAAKEAAEIYKRTVAQVAYTIDSIGRIAVTYKGGLMDEANTASGSTIFGSFLLTAVENLTVNLGVSFVTPIGDYRDPLGIGLGVGYNAGAFGIKARAQAKLAGTDKNTNILFDIQPSFAINDTLKAYLNAGIVVDLPDVGETAFDWFVNPYIGKAVVGGGEFFAGLKIGTTMDGATHAGDTITWSVPVGMIYSF